MTLHRTCTHSGKLAATCGDEAESCCAPYGATKVNSLRLLVGLLRSLVDLLRSLVDLLRSLVDLLRSLVDLPRSLVDLLRLLVGLLVDGGLPVKLGVKLLIYITDH